MVVFMKRRQLAAAALGVLAALTLLFVIPGCQRDSGGTAAGQSRYRPPTTPPGWRIWKAWAGR